MVFIFAGLAGLWLTAARQFGSYSAAMSYLQGQRLLSDGYTKSFGTASIDETPAIDFRLWNRTEKPMRIVGCNVSCTCLVASDLPIDIPPDGRVTFRVSARSRSSVGPYHQRIHLLTDSPGVGLDLAVRGSFR
jgi:hypothetical protein